MLGAEGAGTFVRVYKENMPPGHEVHSRGAGGGENTALATGTSHGQILTVSVCCTVCVSCAKHDEPINSIRTVGSLCPSKYSVFCRDLPNDRAAVFSAKFSSKTCSVPHYYPSRAASFFNRSANNAVPDQPFLGRHSPPLRDARGSRSQSKLG